MNTDIAIKEVISKARGFYDKLGWQRFLWVNIVFWGGGILVGFASVLMTYASNRAESFFHHVILSTWYLPLVTTPFVFMALVFATRVIFPASGGSGIPQIMAALHVNCRLKKLLALRAAVGKYLLLIGLMFGACIGREGPIAQVGACIMLALNPLISKKNQYDFRAGLIMAGSAAGISAAFDTPLAGIVFAIECLARRFEARITLVLLGAVALSGVVGYFILGDYYAYFGIAHHAVLDNMWGCLALIVCSVLGGLLGGIFTVCFVFISKRMFRIKLFPALCVAFLFGLIVVGLGFLSHGLTYGTGYQEARMIMAGQQLPASFPFYKALAGLFSASTGMPGGIFSPALTVGAGLGQIFSHWFPKVAPSAIIIIGMVAFFCGITRVPITSFAIVMQIEHVQAMAVPLVVAALIANICSSCVAKRPFYDALADIILAEHAEPTLNGNHR